MTSTSTDSDASDEAPGHGRSSRLSVRLPAAQKALIAQAADLSGLTTTAFVVSSLVEKARAVIVDARLAALSDADRDAFLAALDERTSSDTRVPPSDLEVSGSAEAVAYDVPSTTATVESEVADAVETPLLDTHPSAGLASPAAGEA